MALLFKQTTPLWGIWKLEETSDELFSLLKNKEAYLSQLEQIHSEVRRKEWLACRVLLQEFVDSSIMIAYKTNGAPYLLNSNLCISMSHTKGYVAVLLQEHPVVGIDIEYRSTRVQKIRSRFMSEIEESSLDKDNEVDHLLLHWCAKETLYKMIGQEDVDFRQHLHVCPFYYELEGTFHVYETRTDKKKEFNLRYWVQPEFVVVYSDKIKKEN